MKSLHYNKKGMLQRNRWLMGCDCTKGCNFYNKALSAHRKTYLDKDQFPGVSTQANFRPFPFSPLNDMNNMIESIC